MKQTIRTYLYTLLLFLIPFILISFILSILSYFMQTNALFIQVIMQILSYFFLMIAALYFTSHLPSQRMKHCLCFALIYFFISLLIHLGNMHYVHLILKPLVFIMIGFVKEIKNHTVA